MEIQDFAYNRHLAALASLPNYKLPADPKKLTTVQLIDKMVQIDDYLCTIYVRNDKPVDPKSKDPLINGLDLSLSSDLALYSCIAKASNAQQNRDADPNYPEAYPSRRADLIFVLFICHLMRFISSVLVLHLTRMIATSNIFIVKSGRLRTISFANPNPFAVGYSCTFI